jgi:hypothetical protein
MPATDLIVRRSDDGAAISFVFEGGTPQVLAVAVVDEDAEQPMWLLSTDASTEVLPYTVERANSEPLLSAEEAALEREFLARGVDPAALEAGRKANRPLPGFEYGKVPAGFRQVMPTGAPLPLEPGRRYCVTVIGGIGVPVGRVSFTA